MRYLLDTHTIIWYFEDSGRLPRKTTALIDNPQMEIFICSVSLWEIAIKVNLGKLKLNLALKELLLGVKTREFHVIQIEDAHLENLEKLPYIHKDPFDRLLISTAITDNMTIITTDGNIQKYDVKWAW